MTRLMVLLAGVAVLSILAAVTLIGLARDDGPGSPAAINIDGADLGGPFELTSHTENRVSSAEVTDTPALIYFGYTFCPDVCPVDAQVMADAVDLLAAEGVEVTPVFVTVDPARDTPRALGQFVQAMHPRMVGLTGSEDDIKAAASAYKVYYARAGDADDPNYLMNHSAFIYLMTPDGLAALFRRGATPEEIADEAERVLG